MRNLLTGIESAVTTNPAHQFKPAIYGNKIVWHDYRNDYVYTYMAKLQ
jgi:beta propeller repeat protein